MNRRLLLAFGIATPLVALFIGARVAASWRPQNLGKLVSHGESLEQISAESGRVSFGGHGAQSGRLYGWLDLSSGKVSKFVTAVPRRTGTANGYRWIFLLGDQTQTLEVTDRQGVKRVYQKQAVRPLHLCTGI